MTLRGDRFSTRVSIAGTPETESLHRVVVHSLEGDSDSMWPDSAPLQEVVPQDGDSGEFLAGIGRSGSGHWSVIVLPYGGDGGGAAFGAEDGDTRGVETGFEFDFACRVKTQPECIGSSYVAAESLGDWQLTSEGGGATIEVGEGLRLVCHSSPGTELEVDGDQLRLSPVRQELALPATLRWKYRFVLRN